MNLSRSHPVSKLTSGSAAGRDGDGRQRGYDRQHPGPRSARDCRDRWHSLRHHGSRLTRRPQQVKALEHERICDSQNEF